MIHGGKMMEIKSSALVNGEFQGDLGGIYLKQQAINTISRKWFSDWRKFLLNLPQSSKARKR